MKAFLFAMVFGLFLSATGVAGPIGGDFSTEDEAAVTQLFDEVAQGSDDVLPRCSYTCPGGKDTCNITCPVGKSASCYNGSSSPRYCFATCKCI